jgi:hypothetical protein
LKKFMNDDNGRRIWNGLKKYLALYSLFKSDRTSSDQDPEAQDPLKNAVKEALNFEVRPLPPPEAKVGFAASTK